MPDTIFEIVILCTGIVVGIIGWSMKRELKSIDDRMKASSSSLAEVRSDVDAIERDGLKEASRLHSRVTDLMADLPKEYVRRQEFEATITDIRQRLGGIDLKLDRHHDEILNAVKKS